MGRTQQNCGGMRGWWSWGAVEGRRQWARVRADCKEHMWMTGKVGRTAVAVAIVYMGTGSAPSTNAELYECLQKDITVLEGDHEVIILGDFNAHLEELGHNDSEGRRLLQLTQAKHMVIANLSEKCTVRVTWTARNLATTIDYGLVSERLLEELREMRIDEDGTGRLGSDHNRLHLCFGGAQHRQPGRRWEIPRHWSDNEMEVIACCLEEGYQGGGSYEEVTSAMAAELKKCPPRPKGSGTEPWWSKEVQTAIRRCQAASRRHRGMVKNVDPEAVRVTWDAYLQCKTEAVKLVRDRIHHLDRSFMEQLQTVGRNAPRRFWDKVKKTR